MMMITVLYASPKLNIQQTTEEASVFFLEYELIRIERRKNNLLRISPSIRHLAESAVLASGGELGW